MGSGASKKNAEADDTVKRLPGSAVPPKPPARATPKQTSFSAKEDRTVKGQTAVNGQTANGTTKKTSNGTAVVNDGGSTAANGVNGHARPKSRAHSAKPTKR